MNHSSDILIIGSGISGLLTAKALLAAGASITLIDKAQGKEASWAGGGILLPLYPWRQLTAISELVSHSLDQYPQLAQELLSTTGIDPEWSRCGLLISKNPDIEQAEAWCRQYHVSIQPESSAHLPPLNSEFDNPLWLPEIAQARNPRLLKSLRALLDNAGVTFIENCKAGKFTFSGNRLLSVETGQGRFHAERVIITTGAWTKDLLASSLTASRIPDIYPVKGQMLLFEARPDTLNAMILDGDRYLIPRQDGRILVGSTVEQDGFDKTATAQARESLYDFATHLLPALKTFPVIAHWAGIRPGTRDGVPFIGRHPDFDNLFINAGHFRNGLVMGPAAAGLLADIILQRQPIVDPTPYQIQP